MKRLVISLISLLLLSVVSCSCEPPAIIYITTTPELETTTPFPMTTTPPPMPTIVFPSDWTEIQTSLQLKEIYRINVFAEMNDIIEYSWKADQYVQFWYTTSIGVPMTPRNDNPMTIIPSDNPYYEPPTSAPEGPQWAYGDEYSFTIGGDYYGTGYYTFKFMPLSNAIKPVPLFFRYRVGKWTIPDSTSMLPPTQEPQLTSTPTQSTLTGTLPSDVIGMASAYDGQEVELSGQIFLAGGAQRLLIDGKSGINLIGNTAVLQRGFYRVKGVYDADTNTLNVVEAVKAEADYTTIEAGYASGISLTAVAVQGLIATPPKEVANMLSSYLSISNLPTDIRIYPYVVYGKDGFYLALSDTLIDLPAKFTFLYQGSDYSFTFSAGEAKGTLIKTPLEQINFGFAWTSSEFDGVMIADTIAPLEAVKTTVGEINANPGNYIFKRVSVNGSYIVTTATVDYSDIKAPMGQGILADDFSDFFEEDSARLETIDPNTRVWQLRRGEVVGTVIYPTDQILKYMDYSAPLSLSEIQQRLKPALIVDTIVEEVEQVADISELNPVSGNPSRYWGKVVEFEGYALGINYPLKELAKAISNTDVPVNVNLLAVGIADKPAIGSQLAIIGLNNDLIGEQGDIIQGRYRFKVAVTQVPEQLVTGVLGTDTAFFLLSKEELTEEIPPLELFSINISIDPSAGGSVTLTPPGGSYPSGTLVTLTAVPVIGYTFDYWSGDASGTAASITVTMDAAISIIAHFRRLL